MLYQIKQGTVSLSGKTILDHIDFHIKGRERVALVGRNGSGKTTLLRLIAGELALDRDDKRQGPGIWMARDTSIGMLSQSAFSEKEAEKTVDELIMAICPAKDPFSREYSDFSVEYRRMFTGLGFAAKDSQKKVKAFSGGEQTRIALIGLLLEEPDLLLLDEPTNHLDLAATDWLEAELSQYKNAVVLVSHDRYFLDQTVEAVWEMADGKLTRYAGNYTSYRSQSRKRAAEQMKRFQAQQQERARLTALIEKYKHKPRKASMARSKKKVLERMEKIEKPREEQVHIFTGEIRPKTPGAKRVLFADKLQIGYEGIPIKEVSLSVRRGHKIGIIGENGTGKTTFLKTIAGILPPVSGMYQLGTGIVTGYYDQLTGQITSGQRVFEHFSEQFPGMTVTDAKKILGQYLFPGEETAKRIADLSGGEKSRLFLAELLTAGPHLLLLDEPTNHMDIPARETLESAFMDYTGTMLFISHDRYFVQQVATSLLVFEKERIIYYPFGYAHYQERRRKLLAQQAAYNAFSKDCAGNPADRGDTASAAGSRASSEAQMLTAAINAENIRLVEELHAVPDRKRMQGPSLSTEQSYLDWQLRLACEELSKCRQNVEAAQRSLEELRAGIEYWSEPEAKGEGEKGEIEKRERKKGEREKGGTETERFQPMSEEQECMKRLEKEMSAYHQACLVWYEKLLEGESEGIDTQSI